MRGDTRLKWLHLSHNNASVTWQWRAGEIQKSSEVSGDLFQSFLFPLLLSPLPGARCGLEQNLLMEKQRMHTGFGRSMLRNPFSWKRGKSSSAVPVWRDVRWRTHRDCRAARGCAGSVRPCPSSLSDGGRGRWGRNWESRIWFGDGEWLLRPWIDVSRKVKWLKKCSPQLCADSSFSILGNKALISWSRLERLFPPVCTGMVNGSQWELHILSSPERWETHPVLGQSFVPNVSSGYSGGMQEEFWRGMLELPLSPGFDAVKPFQ